MRSYLIELLKLLLFWLLFFIGGRILFLTVYSYLLFDVSFVEVLKTFIHAFILDFSTACWLSAPLLLIMSLQYAIHWKGWNWVKKIVMLILLIITTLILFGEIGIYNEWRIKLNHKALLYLREPKEILDSVSTGLLLILLLGFVLYLGLFQFFYIKFVAKPVIKPEKYSAIKSPIAFLVLGFLLFIGMRGGLGGVPISQSQSYFSQHAILNDASVNTQWNLLFNYLHFKSLDEENPFQEMDDAEASKLVEELYQVECDTTIHVLTTNQPNIIFILLESWAADVVESLGGKAGITPYFAELEKEGLLFTHFYANGHRSQQAMSSILSSFPPMQGNDVTDIFSLYQYLGSMPQLFAKKGYPTSFYFGGDLNYGNIRAFILWNTFREIVEEKDFSNKIPRGKLSIHDQYVFERHLQEINKEKEPFFSFLFTASSHSPYDEPKIVPQLKWNVNELPYLNAVKYTDRELYNYIQKAKQQLWYKNTLFVIVSDHSHATYKNHYVNSPEYMHIPMLWIGGALDSLYYGKTCDALSSQIDIYPTLASQIGETDNAYRGKNMLNPYAKEFAYYETNTGFGWVIPKGSYIYDGLSKQLTHTSISDSILLHKELNNGKAFLQTLYNFFVQ